MRGNVFEAHIWRQVTDFSELAEIGALEIICSERGDRNGGGLDVLLDLACGDGDLLEALDPLLLLLFLLS